MGRINKPVRNGVSEKKSRRHHVVHAKQYLNIYDAVKQADFLSLESALTRGIATTEIRDKFNKTHWHSVSGGFTVLLKMNA